MCARVNEMRGFRVEASRPRSWVTWSPASRDGWQRLLRCGPFARLFRFATRLYLFSASHRLLATTSIFILKTPVMPSSKGKVLVMGAPVWADKEMHELLSPYAEVVVRV